MTPTFATITDDLVRRLDELTFSPPVAYTYNPLVYARASWDRYLERFGRGPKEVVFLGMNPGPWGMIQTGVPFGDPTMVTSFLGLDVPVVGPPEQHPKRPILGLESPRKEVSGQRLWSWVRDRFGTAEAFAERCFVANYCPLSFMEESGRNRTPDKLPKKEREPLFAACNEALARTVELLRPRLVVGIGAFAKARAQAALDGMDVPVGSILHPSPASPLANQGWAPKVEEALRGLGVDLG